MQWPEGLLYLIRELELNKWNDQVFNSLINLVLLLHRPIFQLP